MEQIVTVLLILKPDMKATNLQRPMVRFASHPPSKVLKMAAARSVPASGNRTDTDDKFENLLAGVTISIVTGLFALWPSLTILGLENVDKGFLHSFGLRIAVASGLALIFCVVGLPLILPGLMADERR